MQHHLRTFLLAIVTLVFASSGTFAAATTGAELVREDMTTATVPPKSVVFAVLAFRPKPEIWP